MYHGVPICMSIFAQRFEFLWDICGIAKNHILKNKVFIVHDDVIKWKHFLRYWPLCAGYSPVPGEFPTQRPVTRSFDAFSNLHPNKRLSKQWWFETLSSPLWRHCNDSAGAAIHWITCSDVESWCKVVRLRNLREMVNGCSTHPRL